MVLGDPGEELVNPKVMPHKLRTAALSDYFCSK